MVGMRTLFVLLAACGTDVVVLDASTGPCAGDTDCSGTVCEGPGRCVPDDPSADARGCVFDAPLVCGEGETCVGETGCVDRCAEMPDLDADGVDAEECGGTDCDDQEASRFPGAAEICDPDDLDEDCDATTFGVRDADDDTYADAACCNGENCGNDCDDASGAVHPGLAEICDGRDNDCDMLTDEAVIPTWTVDADGDGYGDATEGAMTRRDCLDPGAGWATSSDDCDDAADDVHPGLPEQCNGRDDNCRDGISDESDCDCSVTDPPRSCGTDVGECVSGTETCVAGTWVCDGAVGISTEVCDTSRPGAAGLDEDCDGTADEGLTISSCYVDVDSDTYGEAAAGTLCAAAGPSCPSGYVSRGGDCSSSASINPSASETCNALDDDCDGPADEGLHIRRADLTSGDVPCNVWEYGRDLTCELRAASACGVSSVSAGGYCAFSTGFYIATGGLVTVACMAPPFQRSDIMRWELTARHAGCDGSASEYNACQSAAHRYCAVFGYVTGYTYKTGADTYALICFSSTEASMRSVTWADLNARDGAAEPYCNGPARDGWWCARAVDQYCRELGFATGFGPQEYNSGGGTIACLRSF